MPRLRARAPARLRSDAPPHRGVEALFGDVLAGIYGRAARRALLRLVVDCYAAQHPGVPGRQSAQSVAIHLQALCLWVELGCDPADAPRLRKATVEHRLWPWLEPPQRRGSVTVRDLAEASEDEYEAVVRRWARAVWQAWSPHHETVRAWLAASPV